MKSGRVTKLVAQKRKGRLSVFIDDEFALGVDVVIAARFNLQKDTVVTHEQLAAISEAEERRTIKNAAFRFLGRRAHSEKELRTKLLQKGYSKTCVEEVIEELRQEKFLDDTRFAIVFARSRLTSKPMGERLLRHELWQKGITDKVIEKTLAEAYANRSEKELARRLFETKHQQYKHLGELQRQKRIHDFLIRRGFSWDIVQEVKEESQRS